MTTHVARPALGLAAAALLLAGTAARGQDDTRAQCLSHYRKAEALWQQGKLTEAISSYVKAVELAPAAFGADSLDTANMENNLAVLYAQAGKYASAEPYYKRSLKTREARLGADDLVVAQSLNSLAELYRNMARYDEAEPLYRRSLKIKQARDPTGTSTGLGLNNLALLYKDTGRYDEAEPLFKSALKVLETRLGDHPSVATTLDNLAQLYMLQGRDAQAEPLLARSLKMFEDKLGPNHVEVAICLNNLAFLYHRQMKQLARAEPLYLRALKIQEDHLPANSPNIAQTLQNLGVLYQTLGKLEKAEALFLRSLKIRRAALPAGHPDISQSLNDLGLLYRDMGRSARAEELFKESVKLDEDNGRGNHPALGQVLHNLAVSYILRGDHERAEPLLDRALKIRLARYGEHHPEVARNLGSLCLVYAATGRWDRALDATERDLRILRRHSHRLLSVLPEREQLTFLSRTARNEFEASLSLGLVRKAGAAAVERSAGWAVNAKGLADQAVAERALLARDGAGADEAGSLPRLIAVRRQLATLSFWSPAAGDEDSWRKRMARLAEQEQELSREVSRAIGRPLRDDPWVELAAVRRALPADGALVEIVRFHVRNWEPKEKDPWWQEPHYVAWVIPPADKGSVRIIDLGEAARIEAAVKELRQALKDAPQRIRRAGEAAAEKELRQSSAALADLVLRPLAEALRPANHWVLSPDADLWLVPWAALPADDEHYVLEKHRVSYVTSGRDLVSEVAKVRTGPPLVMADPDYDLAPADARAEARRHAKPAATAPSLRGVAGSARLGRVERLPATAAEAEAITPGLRKYAGSDPRVFTDKQALEAVFKAARRPRVVMLSTHGFFLEDQARPRPEKPGARAEAAADAAAPPENPLLRCGLLLAGCNQRDRAGPDDEDGLLTGLEVVGVDLRGTELVVLSACETGLGEVRHGEGVAGLRQAFRLAGARSVVATLWQVPDKDTALLMAGLFDQLAQGRTPSEGLREAQRARIQARRERGNAAHPFFWAAFTVTGGGE
jgi:CHAT domain-containing protein/Tfp pilus assembly protein PilF